MESIPPRRTVRAGVRGSTVKADLDPDAASGSTIGTEAVRSASKHTYRIKELSALTGVSVRALHHYDRLGLLEPRRGTSGYRMYGAEDVAVLEQIVALKFIGIPLRDIKRLLRTERREWSSVLAAQRLVLEEKRRRLDLAIDAVREAQDVSGQQVDADRIKRIIEVVKMQNQRNEWTKQYDTLLQGKIERLKALSPEAREQLRGEFAELCKDVQGVLNEDPAGPRAHELAGRWLQLLGALAPMGEVDPQLLKYQAAYLSEGGWPAGAPRPDPPFGRPIWEFMARAIAARQ
jgi:MerR family transcriptional regulator, thiopeptide resistance regulator